MTTDDEGGDCERDEVAAVMTLWIWCQRNEKRLLNILEAVYELSLLSLMHRVERVCSVVCECACVLSQPTCVVNQQTRELISSKTRVAYGNSHLACEYIHTRYINPTRGTASDIPLVEFMYLVFTYMPYISIYMIYI